MQEENFRDELGSARIGRGGGSGRASRRARREAGKREPSIWAGASGGQYRPLSDASVERIHKAALEILETVGIGDPTEELLDIVLPKGCFLNEHGRLCFPPSLIEDVLAGAAKDRTLTWDTEAFSLGDLQLDHLLQRNYREGWEVAGL